MSTSGEPRWTEQSTMYRRVFHQVAIIDVTVCVSTSTARCQACGEHPGLQKCMLCAEAVFRTPKSFGVEPVKAGEGETK